MIRFHSKSGADILMLRAHADAVLRALGREPAAQGIFEEQDIQQALNHFDAQPPAEPPEDDEDDAPHLSRRAWPLLQLLRRAQADGQAVIWSSS